MKHKIEAILCSVQQTLAEQLGYDVLNAELAKNSEYYLKNFR